MQSHKDLKQLNMIDNFYSLKFLDIDTSSKIETLNRLLNKEYQGFNSIDSEYSQFKSDLIKSIKKEINLFEHEITSLKKKNEILIKDLNLLSREIGDLKKHLESNFEKSLINNTPHRYEVIYDYTLLYQLNFFRKLLNRISKELKDEFSDYSRVFINTDVAIMFTLYMENINKSNLFPEISFIFQIMKDKCYLKSTTKNQFCEFLLNKEIISNNEYNILMDKPSFNTLSKASNEIRLNMFNKAFRFSE